MTDDDFDALVTRAMDELPDKYIKGLDNVVITMADSPTALQLKKMNIDDHSLLLGLYEGIPLTSRGAGYNFVLPDRITLFKNSILAVSNNEQEVFEQTKRTLWHEIAHYYGLNHEQMDELQNK
jgi:predicted Zn-dependent protease with MMP-like domain